MINFNQIVADPAIGRTIGQAYLSTPERITPTVRDAYAAFARQVDQQYGQLTRDVRVTFTDDDPYDPDAGPSELFRDIRRGSFAVYRTQPDQRHPILTPEQNDRFRAVHDYYGHYRSGRGFDRHGEEAAWVCHSLMFAGEASRALTTETRGQSSAFVWINGGGDNFPPQKAILLPQWMSDIPLRWLV